MEKACRQIISDAVVKSHFYIVQNAHLCKKTNVLESPGHALLADLRRFLSHQAFSIEKNRAVCRPVHTGQHVEGCGFSGSVGADEAHQSAFVNRHIQSVYCPESSKGDSEVFHFQ